MKAVVRQVVASINLQTVFPRLKNADQRMHETALELLLEEAADQATAPVYGKNNVLPFSCWTPWGMDTSALAVYSQTLEMTEPQLQGLRTWIYRQYRLDVMTLQICIIMLWWQVAKTVDEAFFLAHWISSLE